MGVRAERIQELAEVLRVKGPAAVKGSRQYYRKEALKGRKRPAGQRQTGGDALSRTERAFTLCMAFHCQAT